MAGVDNYCFHAIRAVVVLWAAITFGWRGRQEAPRQPKSLPVRVPVQVRPPDPPPVPPKPVSVLVKPPLPFVTGVCPPVRKPTPQRCEVLTDLYCRLENPNYWRDHKEPNDLVTFAHEMQHGANNRVHATTEKHGLYLGNGKGIVITHPNVTITQVAARVPKEKRGKVFDLYMRKQAKEWDEAPCYILDEARAYLTGCIAHKQLGLGKHRSETFDFANELQCYSEVLVDTVKKLDPSYPEMVTLERFVQWQGEELAALGGPSE